MTDRWFFCSNGLVRARVDRVEECWGDEPTYRVVELDGTPCDCWLPGCEEPESMPLDRGGFESQADAAGFALGVCWDRAAHGLLPGVTVEDVDTERARLDSAKRPRAVSRPDDPLEKILADEPAQLDLEGLWDAVEKPAPVVVTRRRQVA